MILKGGPGKITMPDGTEIDVIFDVLNIEFSKAGYTYADFTFCSNDPFPSIAGGRINITSNQIETTEFDGENPGSPSRS